MRTSRTESPTRSWYGRSRRVFARLRARAHWIAENWLTIIAWSELLGGAASAVDFAVESLRGAGASVWPVPAALVFCALSVASGALLLRASQLGRVLSLVVQLAQMFRVMIGGVTVHVAAGLVVLLWYARPGGWDGVLGAAAGFRVGRSPADHLELGLNLVAVFAVYSLVRRPRPAWRRSDLQRGARLAPPSLEGLPERVEIPPQLRDLRS